MAIDLGDGILTLLADTSQLETSLDKVDAQVAASGDRSTQALGRYSKAFSDTGAAADNAAKQGVDAGSTLADAFRLIPPAVQQTDSQLQNMAFSLRSIAPVSEEVFDEVSGHARHGMALASEAAKESFGVGIPRHIRAFLLELPGVATAMEAAFSAVALLFLIDILAKLIEKVIEFSHHAERVSEAWSKVDDVQRKALEGLENNVIKAQIKLDELTGKNLEALQLKLALIDRTTLSGLQGELAKIAKEAMDAFKAMDHIGSSLQALMVGSEKPSEIGDEFNKVKKSVDDALNTRTPQAFDNALKLLNGPDGEIAKATNKLSELEKQQEKISKAPTTAGLPGGFVGPNLEPQIQAWQQLKSRVEGYKAAIEDAQKADKLQQDAEKKTDANKRLEEKIADLKRGEQVEVASIDLVKAKAQLAFQQREISAKQFADIEVKAASDARKANEDYLQKVIDLYKKAGDAKKAAAAQDELDKTKLQNAAKATQDLTNATKFAEQETAKWKKTSTDTVAEMEKFGEIEVTAPFNKIAKDALDLNKDLKLLGIQGWMPVRQQLAAVADAEKKFNAAGIHEGKLWLQVQIMKQKALIKLAQDSHQSTTKQIQDLKKLEKELRTYDGVIKDSKSQVAAAWIGEAVAAGFAADSVGAAAQAILKSVLQSLAGMAFAKGTEQLAEGFARLNPFYAATHGPPGPHFASAAEWFLLGGVASAVSTIAGGSGSGGSSGGGAGDSAASIDHTQTQNQPVQNPVQMRNVQHLASGAIVTSPMLAVVGDAQGGGSGREAVIPLDDPRALQALALAFGKSHACTHNIVVEGIPMHKLARKFSSDVNKGKVRIKSSDGLRVTRRY